MVLSVRSTHTNIVFPVLKNLKGASSDPTQLCTCAFRSKLTSNHTPPCSLAPAAVACLHLLLSLLTLSEPTSPSSAEQRWYAAFVAVLVIARHSLAHTSQELTRAFRIHTVFDRNRLRPVHFDVLA